MTLIIALHSLHDNFVMTTALLLHLGDKNLEEIQQIIISIKAANLAKRAVRAIADLTLIVKKKQLERATKLKPREEYFNCGKKSHYAKDYRSSISNKKKPEESTEEGKRSR